jgi:hypothetical protein
VGLVAGQRDRDKDWGDGDERESDQFCDVNQKPERDAAPHADQTRPGRDSLPESFAFRLEQVVLGQAASEA